MPIFILAQQLGLKKVRDGWTGACPACGYKRGFTLQEEQGKLLWHCHAGRCTQQEILSVLKPLLLGQSTLGPISSPPVQPQPKPKTDVHDYIRRLWRQALPLKGSRAERYLQARGITLLPADRLRYCPSLKHTPSATYLPAMLGLIEHDGKPEYIGIHRTYLPADPKADILGSAEDKLTLGDVEGGALRLADPVLGLPLIIGEGVETVLSAMQITGLPGWSALNAGNLPKLVLPEAINHILLCADADSVGIQKALQAAQQWAAEGRKVQLFIPDTPGADINDLLRDAVPCQI